jgi:hypothetical protein
MESIYNIYGPRLVAGEYNQYKGQIYANNLDEAKAKIKLPLSQGGLNLNPYYAVICDDSDKVLWNQNLPLCVKK